VVFFFQAEDGIRDFHVTGVQTCALPIFRGKEPLVLALFERFRQELAPLLQPPPDDTRLTLEDCWLFLHLLVERLEAYRFLFQDLANLAERQPALARGVRAWLGQLKHCLTDLLGR